MAGDVNGCRMGRSVGPREIGRGGRTSSGSRGGLSGESGRASPFACLRSPRSSPRARGGNPWRPLHRCWGACSSTVGASHGADEGRDGLHRSLLRRGWRRLPPAGPGLRSVVAWAGISALLSIVLKACSAGAARVPLQCRRGHRCADGAPHSARAVAGLLLRSGVHGQPGRDTCRVGFWRVRRGRPGHPLDPDPPVRRDSRHRCVARLACDPLETLRPSSPDFCWQSPT